MTICPETLKPCCDDLCYGGGCIALEGYPMLRRCEFCGGLLGDEGIMETCTCDPDEDYYLGAED